MAAKKKAVKKSPSKKPAASAERCPTCGMAPCNVPSDMRKSGKPKAKRAKKAVPVVPPESAPMVDAETPPFPELTEEEADDLIEDEEAYCPLCDEPEDGCTCGLDDSDDEEASE